MKRSFLTATGLFAAALLFLLPVTVVAGPRLPVPPPPPPPPLLVVPPAPVVVEPAEPTDASHKDGRAKKHKKHRHEDRGRHHGRHHHRD